MPLFDHFHAPLRDLRDWHGFHNGWATFIASALNAVLPENFFAQPNVQFGIEIDVATCEQAVANGPSGQTTGGSPSWSAPAPMLTLPLPLLTDLVEVRVFDTAGGRELVGAVEIVSPANKDRPEHRDAFVSKCASYLQQGIGLVVVDIVTGRHANLHATLLERLAAPGVTRLADDLYATAYRPVCRGEQSQFDTWEYALAVGRALPTVPLWLRGGIELPVDLEATYERTRREQRFPDVA